VAHLVEVAFKGNRKEFFLWDYPDPPPLHAAVIVDVDRGEDLGYIHALGDLAQKRNGGCSHGCGTSLPERKALRLASEKDRGLSKDLDRLNEEARRKAMERVKANGLGMKLSDAEWQWDRKKLTLYFTADKRVDFRNLVRDLASLFRTRIELKQIGVRDEAKRLDGIGRCGRQYCSASWLPELRPVNLGVAKDQRLSLNPSQISGACGRLMCCLRYEHEFYVQSRKRFPKEGKIVVTSLGEEKVVSVDIFRERITLRGVEGEARLVTLADFKTETEELTGAAVAVTNGDDEENGAEGIAPDEISPDLLYTAEHPVFVPPANGFPPPRPSSYSPTSEGSAREGEASAKRRRGRRGGRRGRGNDEPNSPGGH
jgi:cell fate regulator YaaT (PSP1 superfamily)